MVEIKGRAPTFLIGRTNRSIEQYRFQCGENRMETNFYSERTSRLSVQLIQSVVRNLQVISTRFFFLLRWAVHLSTKLWKSQSNSSFCSYHCIHVYLYLLTPVDGSHVITSVNICECSDNWRKSNSL